MKSILIKYLLLTIVFLFGLHCYTQAQQIGTYQHVYDNFYLVNPAAAGQQEKLRAEMVYHRQWLGLPDGPENVTFNIDGYLSNEKIGLGFNVYNDVTSLLGKTGAELTYAYHIPINVEHTLSFGLSIGAKSFSIDFSKIQASDPLDPALLSKYESRTNIDGSFGFLYSYKRKLNIGFAAKQLFGNDIVFENQKDEKGISHRLVQHYYIHADYEFELNHQWNLRPMLVMSSTQGLPTTVQAMVTAEYNNLLSLGLSYKDQSGIGFYSKLIIEDQIGIGYAYEYPTSALASVSSGNHELSLSFRLRHKNERKKSKGKRLSEYDQLALTEQVDQAAQEVEKAKAEQQLAQEQLEKLRKEVYELQKLNDEQKNALANIKRDNEASEPVEGTGVKTNFFTIVGTFGKIEYAKHYQKIIKKELKLVSQVVGATSPSGRQYYFVSTIKTANWGEAQDEVNRLNKEVKSDLIIGSPWIYLKVEE